MRKSMVAGAVVGVGYGAWFLASDELTESKAERAARRGTSMPPTTTEAPTTTAAPPVHDIHAAWVIEENMHPGTTDWNIRDLGAPHSIEGYFDRVSAVVGDVVHLYVSTTAAQWHVEAYRLGWYQGLGGRLVWTSPPQSGVVQASRTIDPATNMVEASWIDPLAVTITGDFFEGCYLFKLVSSDDKARFVPLTIRNDENPATYVVINAVSTWQAYNQWGGSSLYVGTDQSFAHRARVVSFDRPYEDNGAAQFLAVELPLVQLMEQLGLDVTYATSVDIDRHPEQLLAHQAIVSPGHDEYWSLAMRNGMEAARDHGVNLAFFGANAAFRQVRFDGSRLGPERHEICYKSAAEDPISKTLPALSTINWRDPPVNRPEDQLIGAQYECNPVTAPMVVTEPDDWIYAGSGLAAGQRLPGVVAGEYDRYVAGTGVPQDVEIVAHSPLTCGGRASYADMTYYTALSGAGVFDVGTQGWVPLLTPARALPAAVTITTNVLTAFGQGPAGLAHPSQSNSKQP